MTKGETANRPSDAAGSWSVEALARRLGEAQPPTLLDVREPHEWRDGVLPGAVLLSIGDLETQAPAVLVDRHTPLVVYCARGGRSAAAARVLSRLGYTRIAQLEGGLDQWRARGLPVTPPEPSSTFEARPSTHVELSDAQRERYARHLRLPEVGAHGQARLLAARVLVLGLGGLGSPVAQYLAAAGVGTLGLLDHDVVELSNLQRQVLHDTTRVGLSKVQSAERAVHALNPDVHVLGLERALDVSNVDEVLGLGWDLVIDCLDNLATRYALNDAAVRRGVCVVHGSVHRFEGQLTVFWPGRGPCYRCLHPLPPPPALAPSCGELGVLGVLPAVVGTLQATEALKILLELGTPLVGQLMTYDALSAAFRTFALDRDPRCPTCSAASVTDT